MDRRAGNRKRPQCHALVDLGNSCARVLVPRGKKPPAADSQDHILSRRRADAAGGGGSYDGGRRRSRQNQQVFQAFPHRMESAGGRGRVVRLQSPRSRPRRTDGDIQDDCPRSPLRMTAWRRNPPITAKALQTPCRAFFIPLQRSGRKRYNAVFSSKKGRLQDGYCPKKSRFQSARQAYRRQTPRREPRAPPPSSHRSPSWRRLKAG